MAYLVCTLKLKKCINYIPSSLGTVCKASPNTFHFDSLTLEMNICVLVIFFFNYALVGYLWQLIFGIGMFSEY